MGDAHNAEETISIKVDGEHQHLRLPSDFQMYALLFVRYPYMIIHPQERESHKQRQIQRQRQRQADRQKDRGKDRQEDRSKDRKSFKILNMKAVFYGFSCYDKFFHQKPPSPTTMCVLSASSLSSARHVDGQNNTKTY